VDASGSLTILLGFQVNALLKEANNAVHIGSNKNGEPPPFAYGNHGHLMGAFDLMPVMFHAHLMGACHLMRVMFYAHHFNLAYEGPAPFLQCMLSHLAKFP
jgi:hypothetical protein